MRKEDDFRAVGTVFQTLISFSNKARLVLVYTLLLTGSSAVRLGPNVGEHHQERVSELERYSTSVHAEHSM